MSLVLNGMRIRTSPITQKEHICIVSHCYRGEDDVIRIISARKAVASEIQTYNEYRGEL